MSVVSKNPFDLLGDDGEEQSSAVPVAKSAPPKKADTPAAAKSVPGSAPRGGAATRGARYPSRGGPRNVMRDNEPRNTGPTSGDGVAEGFETSGGFDGERVPPSRKGNHNHRQDAHTKGPRGNRPAREGTTGGHSRGSGSRGARIPASGGERRQFERHSGTYQDSQKKVDQGWGADQGSSELKAEVEGEKDAAAEENAPQTPAAEGEDGGWGAPDAPVAETTETAPEAPVEPEEIQKSYDEYLAERASQALGKPKGREVSSDAVEGTAFLREAIDEFFSGKEKASTKAAKAPKKEKIFIEVDGQFASPAGGRDRPTRGTGERGRGGRGGRGAPRGAGRGAPRGAARGRGGFGGASINPTDESAFPALGA